MGKEYEDKSLAVDENDSVKLQCDNVIEARKSNIIYQKKSINCWIIDMAVSRNVRVFEKEKKEKRYQDLKHEIGYTC